MLDTLFFVHLPDILRVGFSGFSDFLLSATVAFTLQGELSFTLCNGFGGSGFNSFHQFSLFLLLDFGGSSAFFLLLSQLLGFDSGNAFFLGNGFDWRIVVADEIEMNINVLLTVDGSSTCGFVNLNPVNKGIEHGVGQFLAVSVLLDQGDKSGSVHLLDFILLNQTFQFLNTLFKHNLFFIVLLNHSLCLSLRQ